MTLPLDVRVGRRTRPNQLGTTTALRSGGCLAHRTLVAWDDNDGYVQFVDDVELVPVEAEQEALPL